MDSSSNQGVPNSDNNPLSVSVEPHDRSSIPLETLLIKHLPNTRDIHDFHDPTRSELQERGREQLSNSSNGPLRNKHHLKMVETDTEYILVFIREIRDTLENYNNTISNQTFGPELIYHPDFTAIQLLLESLRSNMMSQEAFQAKRCAYIIRLPDQTHSYVCTIIYDKRYLNWHRTEQLP